MTYWCIYQITNKINGKRYIGQHKYYDESNPMKRKNRGIYRGSGYNLWRAYKKYGIENFETEILYKRILSLETANTMEIYAIEKYKPEYNIAKGGSGIIGVKGFLGKKHSEETKRKMSMSAKGRHLSDETRRKVGEASKGRKMSDEAKRKISKAMKGRVESDETRRRKSESMKGKQQWLGKHHSEETRRKMSESRKRYWANKRKEKENEAIQG